MKDENFWHKYYKDIITQIHNDHKKCKSMAILEAIRKTNVGSDIIIHNNDMSVWCVLRVMVKEHPEDTSEDGGIILRGKEDA